jgi:hypothetical protein
MRYAMAGWAQQLKVGYFSEASAFPDRGSVMHVEEGSFLFDSDFLTVEAALVALEFPRLFSGLREIAS